MRKLTIDSITKKNIKYGSIFALICYSALFEIANYVDTGQLNPIYYLSGEYKKSARHKQWVKQNEEKQLIQKNNYKELTNLIDTKIGNGDGFLDLTEKVNAWYRMFGEKGDGVYFEYSKIKFKELKPEKVEEELKKWRTY